MQSKKNNTPNNNNNVETTHRLKYVHTVSKSGSQTEISTEKTKVTIFIKETMQTLSVCNEKLKTCLNTNQTHLEMF